MERQLNEVEQVNQASFYENLDELKLSASAIKLLLDSPKNYFERYVLGNKEEKRGKHFDEGSLVHAFVLEPEHVQENFVNMGVAAPSDKTKDCIDYLLSLERNASELEEYFPEIVEFLEQINLHQSLVDDKKPNKEGFMFTGDEKRVAKIVTDNTREYFRLMVEAREKTIVDSASWQKCLEKAEAINSNLHARFLLNATKSTDEIRFELELSDKPAELKYQIKGVLDVIKVDRETKTIYVSDIKTTNGTLKDFVTSSEKFNYWLQEAIYNRLAQSLTVGAAFDYKVVFHFIVVDRNNDVYCFPVSEESSAMWNENLKELINVKVDYHIVKQDFTLPYEFANNLISL